MFPGAYPDKRPATNKNNENSMKRRSFVQKVGLSSVMMPLAFRKPLYKNEGSFFTVTKVKGRSFLTDPEGNAFFSIGINHIDSAPLRYVENGTLWHDKYENSMEQWLSGNVGPTF